MITQRRGRAICAALAALLCAGLALAQPAPDRFAGAAAAYLVIADGRTLYSAATDARLPPASLTKMMTALVIEGLAQPDTEVVVSARAAKAGGARMGLKQGMRLRVADLVAGMLLRSANDACYALADHIDGGERRLVERMNDRARTMALTATHFRNPCGFDAPGQHSSAADLARIAEALLAQPTLAVLVAQPKLRVVSRDGQAFQLTNTNALIGRVPGARGVKTGFTDRAGHCLVGVVERDGVRVLIVLLNARDRWWDAAAMIDAAFDATMRPR
ncbi:MAG: D-alanyl-D-alanine carboxypeptidase [Burkholderiales bacterium]|nr:D-alanyl-D-alanine carboxypeptidase [Burkholderiales bacterium]